MRSASSSSSRRAIASWTRPISSRHAGRADCAIGSSLVACSCGRVGGDRERVPRSVDARTVRMASSRNSPGVSGIAVRARVRARCVVSPLPCTLLPCTRMRVAVAARACRAVASAAFRCCIVACVARQRRMPCASCVVTPRRRAICSTRPRSALRTSARIASIRLMRCEAWASSRSVSTAPLVPSRSPCKSVSVLRRGMSSSPLP